MGLNTAAVTVPLSWDDPYNQWGGTCTARAQLYLFQCVVSKLNQRHVVLPPPTLNGVRN